jgi:hypothetical protein
LFSIYISCTPLATIWNESGQNFDRTEPEFVLIRHPARLFCLVKEKFPVLQEKIFFSKVCSRLLVIFGVLDFVKIFSILFMHKNHA